MTRSSPSRRWAIDGLEEDTARIEEDGGRIITVPRWLLPAEAREGHVLQVTRSAAKGSATIVITVDESTSATANADSKAQTEKIAKTSRRRDDSGDVSL